MENWKIFIVDDDSDDRDIIKDAIAEIDSEKRAVLREAENGEEALLLLHGCMNEPGCQACVIILDLNMPRVNGTELLAELKADDRLRHIPVVIYSSSVNPFDREKCIGLGAHSFVTKPLSYQESLVTAQTFLDFYYAKEN